VQASDFPSSQTPHPPVTQHAHALLQTLNPPSTCQHTLNRVGAWGSQPPKSLVYFCTHMHMRLRFTNPNRAGTGHGQPPCPSARIGQARTWQPKPPRL